MNISFEIIGRNIKNARNALGISPEQIAGKIGISLHHLNLIEHGKQKASIKLLAQIADSLNISIHTLVHGSILDKENHSAIFESSDPETQEYGEYALLLLDEQREQIKRYYEEFKPKENMHH